MFRRCFLIMAECVPSARQQTMGERLVWEEEKTINSRRWGRKKGRGSHVGAEKDRHEKRGCCREICHRNSSRLVLVNDRIWVQMDQGQDIKVLLS